MKRFAKYFAAYIAVGFLAAIIEVWRVDMGVDPIKAARFSAHAWGIFSAWCLFKLGWFKP